MLRQVSVTCSWHCYWYNVVTLKQKSYFNKAVVRLEPKDIPEIKYFLLCWNLIRKVMKLEIIWYFISNVVTVPLF
jgi:hypothetical protein